MRVELKRDAIRPDFPELNSGIRQHKESDASVADVSSGVSLENSSLSTLAKSQDVIHQNSFSGTVVKVVFLKIL